MIYTELSVKWDTYLDVPAHIRLLCRRLCAGEIPGFCAGVYAVKAGGCLTRRILKRPNDPLQYPNELYEDTIIQAVTHLPDAKTGAKAEEAAIGAYARTVNKRRKVSKHEHKGADTEPLGSAVYVKVVRLIVANSKDTFGPAWDQHKASNPHKYECTLRKNHTTKWDLKTSKWDLKTSKYDLKTSKYDLKTSKLDLGTDKKSQGTDKKSQGTDKTSQGTDKKSLGLDKKSLGLDQQSLGLDKQSLRIDKKSLGTGKLGMGTNKAIGPAVGAKYNKSTSLPHGNLPALVKMLRTSFSDEQLRVVFNRKSAGRFSSEFPSSRAPTSLHHLCNQESSPAAFKGFRCNPLRFKGLQQLYNDQSK